MKVPVLKLYVLTDKTLGQKLEAARTEARVLQNMKIAELLDDNCRLSLALRNQDGGKRRRDKDV